MYIICILYASNTYYICTYDACFICVYNAYYIYIYIFSLKNAYWV